MTLLPIGTGFGPSRVPAPAANTTQVKIKDSSREAINILSVAPLASE